MTLANGLPRLEKLSDGLKVRRDVFDRFFSDALGNAVGNQAHGMMGEVKAMQWAEDKFGIEFIPERDLMSIDGKILIEVKISIRNKDFLERATVETYRKHIINGKDPGFDKVLGIRIDSESFEVADVVEINKERLELELEIEKMLRREAEDRKREVAK